MARHGAHRQPIIVIDLIFVDKGRAVNGIRRKRDACAEESLCPVAKPFVCLTSAHSSVTKCLALPLYFVAELP